MGTFIRLKSIFVRDKVDWKKNGSEQGRGRRSPCRYVLCSSLTQNVYLEISALDVLKIPVYFNLCFIFCVSGCQFVSYDNIVLSKEWLSTDLSE